MRQGTFNTEILSKPRVDSSSPREERVGRGSRRGEFPIKTRRLSPTLSSTSQRRGRRIGCQTEFERNSSVFGFRAAKLLAVLLFALAFCPSSLWACAACTGLSDSPLAVAMNWGIVTLLGVVLTVLSGVLVFFVHVIRKEETASNDATPQNPPGA